MELNIREKKQEKIELKLEKDHTGDVVLQVHGLHPIPMNLLELRNNGTLHLYNLADFTELAKKAGFQVDEDGYIKVIK